MLIQPSSINGYGQGANVGSVGIHGVKNLDVTRPQEAIMPMELLSKNIGKPIFWYKISPLDHHMSAEFMSNLVVIQKLRW